jgi:hypothetical protein
MQAKYCTTEELYKALEEVNKMYFNNIDFKRLDTKWSKIIFTLKVKNNDSFGTCENLSYALNNMNGQSNKGHAKHNGSASWFVHGHFFEELLKINSRAQIESTLKGEHVTIDINGGNWKNVYLGSEIYGYISMSELADNEP